jgi:hypothetical protein
MNGLRSVRPVRRCVGLLLGLLLVLGPVAQSVAASQRPCGRAPASQAAPAAVDARTEAAPGAQWTCDEQAFASALRALPSERPDGSEGGAGAAGLDGDALSTQGRARRNAALPARPFISPTLAALRPVVLLI